MAWCVCVYIYPLVAVFHLYDLYTFIPSGLSCLVGSRGLVRSTVLFVMWWLINKLFT
jgi:hypothetical protein